MNTTRLIATAMAAALLTTSALAQDKVLRFATWDSDESLAIQESIARMFEAANPGVTVQVEAYGDGYDEKLTAAMGAGDPPDVMYMWNFPAYAASLMPMEDLIARDAAEMDLADISPALMNISTIDGHTYGMPAGFTTQVVFYNKDMFAAAGIAEPQAGWTWDDLRAAAAQFRDAATNTYGFAVDAKPDAFDFEQFYWSNGTQFISDDGTTVDGYMNSAAGAEVLDMFADMIKTEEAVALNIGDDTSGSTLFKAGRIAMFQSAMWSMTGIQSSGINFGVVVLPNFGDQPAQSAIGASAMSIAKDAAEPELAWEFVKFFSSPEAVAMRTGDLPIRMSVAAAKGLTEDPIFQPFFTMLDQTTVHTAAFLQNENWGRIQENLSTAIEATMIDQGNAQAHLDEAVARSARFLN